MANRIAKVAEMLGVELDEVFEVVDIRNNLLCRCVFTKTGLECKNPDLVLRCLILGDFKIKKLPWKPKDVDKYWTYVNKDDEERELCVMESFWYNDFVDKVYYRLGFVYKTKEEAEADLPRAEKFFSSNAIIDWEGQQQ